MTLLETIKKDQLQARKDRNKEKASLLTTLLGEAQMPGKNDGNRESTDVEVVAIVKKFIKNSNEIISNAYPAADIAVQAQNEIDTLEKYLPEQIEGQRLEMTLIGIVASVKAESIRDMGKVMKVLKEQYAGRYDGKEASTLIKELLK